MHQKLATMAAIIVVLLVLCGYTPKIFADSFLKGSGNLLSVSEPNSSKAYPFISVDHLIDISNFQFLISPFAVFVAVIIIVFRRKEIIYRNTEWLFQLLVALCGLGFIVAIASELGMSRDWDLFSAFCLGIITLGTFAVTRYLNNQAIRQSAFAVMIGITLLHTAGFVWVNADEERSLARFRILPRQPLLRKAGDVFCL